MAGGGGENELNLVPYMDVLLNLIIYMVWATQDAGALQEVPVILPQNGGGGGKAPVAELVHMEARIATEGVVYFQSSDKKSVGKFEVASQAKEIGEFLQGVAALPSVKPQLVMTAEVGVPMGKVITVMDLAQNPKYAPEARASVPDGASPGDFTCQNMEPANKGDPPFKVGPFCNVVFNPPGKASKAAPGVR